MARFVWLIRPSHAILAANNCQLCPKLYLSSLPTFGPMHPALSDPDLWAAFRQGDAASLSLLYERHYRALFRYGCKLALDRDRVEDALQDVFLDLWRTRGGLGQVSAVFAYLAKCLRRKLLRHPAPAASPLASNPDQYPFWVEYAVEDHLVAAQAEQETQQKLARALAQLTPRQKEAIYLKFYHQLDYEQIGAIMDIHYQSIRTLIYQAVKSLRQQVVLGTAWLAALVDAAMP
jgi:RNA polymerase sigma factor (sigma-70 family)